MSDPRYPIGPFSFDITVSERMRAECIAQLAALPAEFRAAFDGLPDDALEVSYRPGGWTMRQLAHHVPDSHMNGYVRFKLALTERAPTIKPYDEQRWSELADTANTSVRVSLDLLAALHERWATLLHSLDARDFARTYIHPEHGRALTLDVALANYAWHGRHHTAHALAARRHTSGLDAHPRTGSGAARRA